MIERRSKRVQSNRVLNAGQRPNLVLIRGYFLFFFFSIERYTVSRPGRGGLFQLPLMGIDRLGDNVHLQSVSVHLHEAVSPDWNTVRRDGRLRYYRMVRPSGQDHFRREARL